MSDEATNTTDPNLVATAYHEAGHAVMAMILGRNILKVTITPGNIQTGGVRLGTCQLKKGRTKASKDELEDEVLILMAGMVAEAHWTGSYHEEGARLDMRAVERLLCTRAGTEKQHERLHRRYLDKTEYLLRDDSNAKAIELIANELIARSTISGRSVRHLFEQAQRS